MPDINNQEQTAFVQKDNIYNKEIKSIPIPKKEIGVDTQNTFFDNIINAGISNNLDYSSLNSFIQVSQSRDQIYALMDMMAEDSIVAEALELYAENTTEYNDKGQIVWCESNDSDITKYVQFLLDSMNVDKNIYSWAYSLIKYGDLYLRLYRESEYIKDDLFEDKQDKKAQLNEDVKIKAYSKNDHFSHYIERYPNPAEIFELVKFGKSYAYIQSKINAVQNQPTGSVITPQPFQFQFQKNDIFLYGPTNFVHAILEDNSSRTPEEVNLIIDKDSEGEDTTNLTYKVRRGQPLLYSIYKIWRLLKLLENSMILNRTTKSSIVRLVEVDVGDMPKEMVGPHLQGIKAMMEQKTAINTGVNIQEYTNPGPTENNIYIPKRGETGAINIQAIGGDTNVTGLEDINYFKNLFYGALGIPKQYLGDTDDATGFNGGTSLAIVSSRFAKKIKRIQNTICQALTDVVNIMLLDAGLDSYINKFTIRMQPPTTQEEIDRKSAVSNELQIARDILQMLDEANFQNPVLKLEVARELLSSIITNPEVLSIIQEEIDKLKEDLPSEEENTPVDENGGEDIYGGEESFSSEVEENPESLASEEIPSEEITQEETAVEESPLDNLPSPEELNVGDFTNNNNPEI